MALAKSFHFAENSVELQADIFNVFNIENVTRVNNTYGPNPAQPAATFFTPPVANPRQFQFAVRYRF